MLLGVRGNGMRRVSLVPVCAFLLLVAVFGVVLNVPLVRGSDTIYIRADGSIDPPSAPITSSDNVTYTFTDNIYDSIVVERNNITIDGAGYTLQGAGTGRGIDLNYYAGAINVTVRNIQIKNFEYGIWIYTEGTLISGNNITANSRDGVYFDIGHHCTVSGNNITANSRDGVYLYSCYPWPWGITVSGNNIANNSNGVYLDNSRTNEFYHNNFMNNSTQVTAINADNSWDDGYPSGGNYWSDYTGTDAFNGPYQNETGSDFKGDTPYVINSNNIDHYPLMIPYETTPPAIAILSPENKTYTVNASIPLTFTVDELASWMGYSLNGQPNATITGNTTLPVMSMDCTT
jgi:parallel beta-helix repeat protein